MRGMHADLVGAPREKVGMQHAVSAHMAHEHEHGARREAAACHLDASIAARKQVLLQGYVDFAPSFGEATLHQERINLAHRALADGGMKRDQGAALLGQQQDARGIAVEPVHQLEVFEPWPRQSHLFDDAAGNAAAAMHGDPGRLVDGEQVIVFAHDGRLKAGGRPGRRKHRVALRNPYGRNPHPVADLHAIGGIDPSAIDPDLTGTHEAIDVLAGHALQHLEQHIVDTLPRDRLVGFYPGR
jgi:hypothetical protein